MVQGGGMSKGSSSKGGSGTQVLSEKKLRKMETRGSGVSARGEARMTRAPQARAGGEAAGAARGALRARRQG